MLKKRRSVKERALHLCSLLAHIQDDTGDVVPAAPIQRFFNQSLEGVFVAWSVQHLPNRLQSEFLVQPVCTDEIPVTRYDLGDPRLKSQIFVNADRSGEDICRR